MGLSRVKPSAIWRSVRNCHTWSTRASRISQAAVLSQSGDEVLASFSRSVAADSGRSQAKSRLSGGMNAGCCMTDWIISHERRKARKFCSPIPGSRKGTKAQRVSEIRPLGIHSQNLRVFVPSCEISTTHKATKTRRAEDTETPNGNALQNNSLISENPRSTTGNGLPCGPGSSVSRSTPRE